MYHLIGKRVRVHLYSRKGISLGTVEGRVADVAGDVEVAEGMNKNILFVVDIDSVTPDGR